MVASKGGAPEHPGWYRNILADPDVEVQVGTAEDEGAGPDRHGEERARLWEKSLEFWPPYADYQRKTEREIPVVVLDRCAEQADRLRWFKPGPEVRCVSHAADASRNPMAHGGEVGRRRQGKR